MGCWNGTCGVTQLHINHGDPVAYFLLANVDDHEHKDDGHCYAEDIWCPLGLPIYAEYNDYGSIEEFKNGDQVDHYINLMRRCAIAVKAKNEWRAGVDPERMDFDHMEDALHDGILEIHDQCGFAYSKLLAERVELDNTGPEFEEVTARMAKRRTSFRVGVMMVHQEIYDALSSSFPHWISERPVLFKTVYADAKIAYAKLVEYFAKNTSVVEQFGPTLMLELAFGRRDAHKSVFQSFFQAYPTYASQYIEGYSERLIEFAKAGVEEPDLLREVCKFQIFRINMQMLRKTWAPQSGAGSQSENLMEHYRLMGAMRKLIERKRQEREADEISEEEAAALEDESE